MRIQHVMKRLVFVPAHKLGFVPWQEVGQRRDSFRQPSKHGFVTVTNMRILTFRSFSYIGYRPSWSRGLQIIRCWYSYGGGANKYSSTGYSYSVLRVLYWVYIQYRVRHHCKCEKLSTWYGRHTYRCSPMMRLWRCLCDVNSDGPSD